MQVLTNTRGVPWTQNGFRASWNGALEPPPQKQGVLPRPHPLWPIKHAGLVFYGLRKSAVVMLLEVGCTTAEVQAITGQSMPMVEHYAKQVNQKKLAAAAILKWENAPRTEFVNNAADLVQRVAPLPSEPSGTLAIPAGFEPATLCLEGFAPRVR